MCLDSVKFGDDVVHGRRTLDHRTQHHPHPHPHPRTSDTILSPEAQEHSTIDHRLAWLNDISDDDPVVIHLLSNRR